MFSSRITTAARRWARRFRGLSDDQLREKSLDLKYDAMCDRLKPRSAEAFGLVTEALRRRLGKTLYDVQLMGGIHMFRGAIAEMKTGEGKTLTAALPAYCLGLSGRGCHVVTVNDYLACRDHEMLSPVFQTLGLSAAVVTTDMTPDQRREAYRCDVTYGTAKELGFDFLRDRIAQSSGESGTVGVQRELNAVLIDEADSILLDEARTPLIIGTIDHDEASRDADCYRWASMHAADFVEGTHFDYDELRREIEFNHVGIQGLMNLKQRGQTRDVSFLELRQFLERAVMVRRNFHRDTHYAVVDDEIVIIDEFTGRPAEGRQWQAGIHQAIEAKEGVKVSPKRALQRQ